MKIKCVNEKKFNDDIKVGSLYNVYGISSNKDHKIFYLITNEEDAPFWYSAELFIVENNFLSILWNFKFWGNIEIETPYDYSYEPYMISGYKELVFDNLHLVKLIEREKEDLEIFCKRKKEMDEFESLIK